MSVLSACREAAIELQGYEPSSIFSTSDQFCLELRAQANKTAVAVAKAHDWRALTTLHTIEGDGATTAFPLPSDYDRMLLKGAVYSTRSQQPLSRPRDLDQWLEMQMIGVIAAPGYWNILGRQMHILPVPATGEDVQFYYISNQIVSGSKTAFSADADEFILSERLITLGVIWRWRAMKRLEYAEDLKNFEIALSEEAGRDKGSRVLHVGRARHPMGDVSIVGTIGSGGASGLEIE